MYREKVTQFLCSDTEPIVQTKAGKLRGFQVNGTYTFYGIKYADAERFMAPRPVEPWDGVKDAIEYGYCCPDIIRGEEPWGWFLYPRRKYFGNENCQYLNLWTQHLDPEAKRPVMVWIHGGGYFGGSGIDLEAYDGEDLSRDGDVVAITLNHRLNIYGFFNLNEFGGEYANSGNAGIADLVAALVWVRENIAQFGGDPDNVTIMGQSGGGGKVTTLLQTAAADGLYHKVILQSGVIGTKDNDRSALLTPAILEELHITGANLDDLSQLSHDQLVDAAEAATKRVLGMGKPLAWGPVPGDYYRGYPTEHGFRKETEDIPMLIGCNLFELDGTSPAGVKSRLTREEKRAMVAERVGEKTADEVMAEFGKAYPEMDVSYAGATDIRFRIPQLLFMEKRYEMAKAPVWCYMFTYESLFMGGVLPGHGGELPFMFGNADHNVAMFREGVSGRLMAEMERSWLSFAYTGNPNGSHIAKWEAWDPERRACMNLGCTTVLKHGHDERLLQLLKDKEIGEIKI